MAVSATPYDASVLGLMATGGFVYLDGDAQCALTTGLYTPSPSGHFFMSDITSELTDVSYARVPLTGKSSSYHSPSKTLSLVADDVVFPNLVATGIRYAIFFFSMGVGTDSTSPLIGYWDLGANVDANANNFKIIFDVSGFMRLRIGTS